MKTSIYQNTLFVVVISLFFISTESVMISPTHTRYYNELKAIYDQNRSSDFLVSDVGHHSKNVSLQMENTNNKLSKNSSTIASSNESQQHRPKKPSHAPMYEKTLLRLLGIRKPEKPHHKIKVPQYMLDLYRQLVTKNTWTSLGRRYRREGDYFEGNTVRSFEVKTKDISRGGSSTRMRVKVVVDGHHYNEEKIRGAELRIFYQPTESKSSSTPEGNSFRHTLKLYRVTRCRPICRRKLLHVNYFEDSRPNWISFNVTEALRYLKKDSNLHLTFEMDDIIEEEVNTSEQREKSTGRILSKVNSEANDQPILVVYSDSVQHPSSSPRHKRSSSEGQTNKHSRKGNPATRSRSAKNYQTKCSRRNLYVDFAELDWLEWIVAPSGFHAFMCQGNCHKDIQNYNATNHAILQSILNSKNPALAPPTCCVPTQLSPIALLIVNFDTVVLQNYKDMIVDACGCR